MGFEDEHDGEDHCLCEGWMMHSVSIRSISPGTDCTWSYGIRDGRVRIGVESPVGMLWVAVSVHIHPTQQVRTSENIDVAFVRCLS